MDRNIVCKGRRLTQIKGRKAAIILWLFGFLLFFGCELCCGGQIIRFGWHQGGTLSLNKERAAILAKYLSNRLKMEVIPVEVANLAALSQGLIENSIDVASIPNYSYPPLISGVHLLATSEYENKKRMYLYLLANRKSGVEKVEDLKGKVAAQVVERNQLKCYFLAESIKANPEEYLKRVDTYKQLRDAVDAVAEGRADTTCLSSTAWEILTKFDPSLRQKIKIIKRSTAYAMDPVVASRKLHESIWWNIQAGLISMSRDYAAQQILMQMGIQGFGSPVTDLAAYPEILPQSLPVPTLKAQTVKEKRQPDEFVEPATASPVAAEAAQVPVTEAVDVVKDPEERKMVEEKSVESPKPAEKPQVIPEGAENSQPSPVQKQKDMEEKVVPQVVAQEQVNAAPKSALRRGLTNELYLRGGLIVLILILGLTVLSMVRRSSKNKTLTVLLLLNERIAALRSSLDWKGKLQIQSCHISEGTGSEAITKLLATIGHKPAMKLALILNSDRIIVKEFTFPFLTASEVQSAIHWKLQDLNVPYDKENDAIYHTVTNRDRKQKQISLMAMVQPKNVNGIEEWVTDLPVPADSILCVQMALLSRFRKCCPGGKENRVMLAYRLNDEEALVLILQGANSFVSRRIYATEHFSHAAQDGTEVWRPFLPELEQTVNFQNRSSGSSLETLYLSGLGVSDTPDPNGYLADTLDVNVEGIDFLSDMDVTTGVREGCPAIEILAGASLIYHKQDK